MSAPGKMTSLLLLSALCGAGIFLHGRLAAPALPLPQSLYSVVNDQLSALRAADFRSAYAHAALGVQERFSIPQFEEMVRSQYGDMTRPARVEFGAVEMHDSEALVQIFCCDQQNVVRPYVYTLVAERGGWKISGVRSLPALRPGQRLAGVHA